MDQKKTTVYRRDYRPPPFWVDDVELDFDLDPSNTEVTARIKLRRNPDREGEPLELAGEQLELKSIAVDGTPLDKAQFQVAADSLTISSLPDNCVLETRVVVHPDANKSLYGLYQSAGNFCTQCEAHGFRKITYFLDRPDVMARYRVTLRANQQRYPVLLSNGNRVARKELDDGRHEIIWEDPFPKPSYLFALVGGDLQCHRGTHTTRSGREVALEIWVEPQNIGRCDHALVSLQKSMRWDEEVFGLEYDLDIYMIVAVNDFNMGAMENKGLNIFNSKYVLASPETATDDDYLQVEAVIAHEYFHNWTGNRVTCRDWFQLTLKEGLTVFRDQQFTADQISPAVKRIDDVNALRSRQFLEDAGPMAHPIRPESYISMDNFYTATVYDKGAEVIRMYHTLLGADGFRRGMDLYFQRHDGMAVTCDDFRAAMADANDTDLSLFDRWYSQPGTPELEALCEWDPSTQACTLTLSQSYPSLPDEIPGAAGRQPVPIPVAVGLLSENGEPFPVGDSSDPQATMRLFVLDSESNRFTIPGISSRPIPSLLRDFSAPVRLRIERSREELAFLMAHDEDAFNRWDAGQRLAASLLLEAAGQVAAGEDPELPDFFAAAFGRLLADETVDGSFLALALGLPAESIVGQEMNPLDPDSLHEARQFFRRSLANHHIDRLQAMYDRLAAAGTYQQDADSVHTRRLKNVALGYLAAADNPSSGGLVLSQFEAADNMTDSQAALAILAGMDCPERDQALERFYDRWRSDPLVLDKWFAVQAASSRSDTLERVTELTEHPDFRLDNPNRVRSLLGVFGQNQVRFHRPDGSGYRLLGDFVLKIDENNPQLAARLVSALNGWRRMDPDRQTKMKDELARVAGHDGLSKDVFEIVERALSF